MKRFFLISILIWSLSSYSQSGFQFPEGVDKIEIPFESSNNIIIIPVKVNGTEHKFIVDTGASYSIIFNLERMDSINVRKGQRLKISGYGEREPFDVFFSDNNHFDIFGFTSNNAELFIMADEIINLSGLLGTGVHGLMGFDFFKEFIVEIDYEKNLLKIYRRTRSIKRKLRRMTRIPMQVENRKPYVDILIKNNSTELCIKSLIDTGNADALWMLPPLKKSIIPKIGFTDFLGTGLSGTVNGVRSKVNHVYLGDYELNEVTVSLPDEESFSNKAIDDVNHQIAKGSIGGEVLSRFKVFFDYKNSSMYVRPQSNFKRGFYYNMAGLELIEGDLEIFTTIENVSVSSVDSNYNRISGTSSPATKRKKIVRLAPKLLINYVRPDSPADQAGLKIGDVILKVNSISRANLSAASVSSKFFKNPFSNLRFIIRRDNTILNYKFKLVPVI